MPLRGMSKVCSRPISRFRFLPAPSGAAGWSRLYLILFVAEFFQPKSWYQLLFVVYFGVGSDYANHDGSQKSKGCKKGNHVQVPCKGHLCAPDYLCSTERY